MIEQVRRAQLIEVTIALVAEHGYAGTSLARIAEGAEITKAAVLYHFPSKDAVVEAARAWVLEALVAQVGAAVEAATTAEAPAAYVRAMVGHFRDHPRHTRMIIEASLHTGGGERPEPETRWRPLAGLLEAAGTPGDPRTTAIILSGAIDGIVTERLADPAYDCDAAAGQLIATVLG